MKNCLFMIFLFTCFIMFGQKEEAIIIDNATIKAIIVNGDAIFKIKVKTNVKNSISLTSKTEGEYAQNSFIKTKIINNTLIISSIYKPLVKMYNDKLSAHKVLSIEVVLEIPEQLEVYIKSNIASAEIYGSYKKLMVELNQGNASLNTITGNAIINAINGNINIETNYSTLDVLNKNGRITKAKLIKERGVIDLHTINGNINIYKAKN